MFKYHLFFPLHIICILLLPLLGAGQNYTVSVKAVRPLGYQTIIFMDLPGATEKEYTAYNISDLNQSTTVQRLISGKYVLMLTDTLAAEKVLEYRLSPKRISRSATLVTASKTDSSINVFIKNKPVFQYKTAVRIPNADSPAVYAGSGFIHPLYSPDGQVLTDGFPAGHAHQNGLFSAWTRATFKGDTIDFWNRHQGRGKVVHLSTDTLVKGGAVVQMQTTNAFVSTKHGAVLHETWTTTIYPNENSYQFDIELEQRNITDDTLFLLKYHYGGLAVRGNKAWNPVDKENFTAKWQIRTDSGHRDSAANETHANWVTGWGSLKEGYAGVAIFSAPENFRTPQAIRVHPTMPYWCFAPCIDGNFFIAPGQSYKARYRVVTFSGQPDLQHLAEINTLLHHPPSVQVSVR